MRQIDKDIIDLVNRKLRGGVEEVTRDEYLFCFDLSKDKSPISIMESVILFRCQRFIDSGRLIDISSELYCFSIALMDDYKPSAFKIRRYSHQFRLLHQMISSDLKTLVHYLEDQECSTCRHVCGKMFDIEKEAVNPSIPVEGCELPFNMCRSTPMFEFIRDERGRLVEHGKDYKSLINLNIIYNEN